jgi:hypothetical protein
MSYMYENTTCPNYEEFSTDNYAKTLQLLTSFFTREKNHKLLIKLLKMPGPGSMGRLKLFM